MVEITVGIIGCRVIIDIARLAPQLLKQVVTCTKSQKAPWGKVEAVWHGFRQSQGRALQLRAAHSSRDLNP